MSVVIIPARYASTRLPGKPLLKIDGTPMIRLVAERCLKSKADRVIVVTDNSDILDVCEKVDGLEVTMSDPEIKSGTDRVAKAAKFIYDDVIVNVQGDEPFIEPSLINKLIDELEKDKNLNMVTACVPVSLEEAKNPNCVKVVVDSNGFALYFSRSLIPYDRDVKGCEYLKHIGIYGYNRDFLLKFSQMEESFLESTEKLEQLRALENGYKIKVLKTDYNNISIDTEEDLKLAEKIIKGDK